MDELVLQRLSTAELDILDACKHEDDERLQKFRREWKTLIEDIQTADAQKQLQTSTILQAQQTVRVVTVVAQSLRELEEIATDYRAKSITEFTEKNRSLGPSACPLSQYALCQRFFLRHLHNPMPSHSAMSEITRRTALDADSVLKWFRRTRKAIGYLALRQQYAKGDKYLFRKMLRSVLVSHDPSISVSQEANDAILLLRERAQQLFSGTGGSDLADETSSSRSKKRKAKKRIPTDAKLSISELRHRSTSTSSSTSLSFSESSMQRTRSCSATPSLTDGESCSSTPEGSFIWPCTFVNPETPSSLQESLERMASNSVRKRKRDGEDMNEDQEEPLAKQLKLQSPEPAFSFPDSPLFEEHQSIDLECPLPFPMDQPNDPTQSTIMDGDFFLNPDPTLYQLPFNNFQLSNCSDTLDWSSTFGVLPGAVEVAQDYEVVFDNFLDAPVNPTAALETFPPVSGLRDEKASDTNDNSVGVVSADSGPPLMDAPAINLILEQLMAECYPPVHGAPNAELNPVSIIGVAA